MAWLVVKPIWPFLIALTPPALYGAAVALTPTILPPVPVPSPATSTPFEPLSFFEGETRGQGKLHTIDGETRSVEVTGSGKRLEDGALELTQRVSIEGKPDHTRVWRIVPEENRSYRGDLTDATEEVLAMSGGRRMVIAYTTGDTNVRQTLTQIDPDTVINRLDVYKWGLNVARLDETITRQ